MHEPKSSVCVNVAEHVPVGIPGTPEIGGIFKIELEKQTEKVSVQFPTLHVPIFTTLKF